MKIADMAVIQLNSYRKAKVSEFSRFAAVKTKEVSDMLFEKFHLDGRVAIVTGSGRGLGKAMALALAEAGADIAVSARTKEQIQNNCLGNSTIRKSLSTGSGGRMQTRRRTITCERDAF